MATTSDSTTFLVGKRFPNRLFVGGLPPNTEAVELAEHFRQYGTVTDAKVIADEQNISKGYGFVTFKSTGDVKNVIRHGTLFFKDKKINIGPAVKKDGPMIQPETVIVPKAPSKGVYFYPGPAGQYVPVQPLVEPCYVPEPGYITEPCYMSEQCYMPEPCYTQGCYTNEPWSPDICYVTCPGQYQFYPVITQQQCYQPVSAPPVQVPAAEGKSAKRRRRAIPPRFKRSS